KVEAMSKSDWTEKDQIENFLKERRLMRSLEKAVLLSDTPVQLESNINTNPSDNLRHGTLLCEDIVVQFCFFFDIQLIDFKRETVSLRSALSINASAMIALIMLVVKPESFGYQSPMLMLPFRKFGKSIHPALELAFNPYKAFLSRHAVCNGFSQMIMEVLKLKARFRACLNKCSVPSFAHAVSVQEFESGSLMFNCLLL
ncbi:hypothetical protein Tco_0499703, partial [Tanacetum coccineum]